MKTLLKKYSLYLIRWQLSTPILAGCILFLKGWNTTLTTMIANLIGGLLFFWVDKYIFTGKILPAAWEIREQVKCSDCGEMARGYRLVYATGYDRTKDPEPQFRCEACSIRKGQELVNSGVCAAAAGTGSFS